jgi:hypothetical protein
MRVSIFIFSILIKRSSRPSSKRICVRDTSNRRKAVSSSNRLIKFLPRPSRVCSRHNAVDDNDGEGNKKDV